MRFCASLNLASTGSGGDVGQGDAPDTGAGEAGDDAILVRSGTAGDNCDLGAPEGRVP